MTPYYFELNNYIPFKKDELLDISLIKILENIDTDNFVRKDNYSVDIINQDFVAFLVERGIELRKVVVWHWLAKNPYIAHIDSGPDGDTITAAINWTLTKGSKVNFYEPQDLELEVKFGNQDLPDWSTSNVGSYIPINVKDVDPITAWSSEGPCLINPALPHMIVAETPRVAVSLQLKENIPFDELVKRFEHGPK
jgi:hypothetical protein